MRSACISRRLGRCADITTPILARPWSSSGAGATGPDNGFRFTSYTQNRSLTSSPVQRTPWKVTTPQPPNTTTTPATLSEQFRAVMRLLPHPVVVCTAKAPNEPTPRGMTMSSLTSLALHPTPLVTFNITTPSRTLDAITADGTARTTFFYLHVLRGDPHGAAVAEWFRRGNAEGLRVFDAQALREGCGCEQVVGDNHDDDDDASAPPLLRGRGVLYALRCRLLEDEPFRGLVRVRDHVVVLAEVVEIVQGEGEDEEFGLAYADRRYRQVGATMVYEKEE